MLPPLRSLIAALALLLASTAALAHTGHGASGFVVGLEHPFGADHLLAMVAVGIWSVFALPAGREWMGPAMFMLSLVVSAALGASGVSVPYLEHAIAASVVVFGLMLVAASRRLPTALGLGLIALAAALHGLAHGAEAPVSQSFVSYAAGFLLTTAALHFSGVFGGIGLRRWFAAYVTRIVGAIGLGFGAAGVYLLMQL